MLTLGIHHGVPFDVYAADPGVNNSTFGHDTPAHALHELLHGSTDTPTFRMGRALHVAALEPTRFDDAVVVRPEFEGKGARAARAEWMAAHAAYIQLTPKEMATVLGMRDGLRRKPAIAAMLDSAAGHSEVTVIWLEGEVRCKARVDRFVPGVLCLDLKTAASIATFDADAYRYGYHRQLAWYRRGLTACGQPQTPWTLVLAENEPPHEAAIAAPDEQFMALGERDAEIEFQKVAACVRSGRWPGYGDAVRTLALPDWVLRQRRSEL